MPRTRRCVQREGIDGRPTTRNGDRLGGTRPGRRNPGSHKVQRRGRGGKWGSFVLDGENTAAGDGVGQLLKGCLDVGSREVIAGVEDADSRSVVGVGRVSDVAWFSTNRQPI